MAFSMIAAVVLGATALGMVMTAHAVRVRRMAWIPGIMAAMELAMAGALLWWEYPFLTGILMACRIVVLFCCMRALKRDAAAMRHRQRQRVVWRRVTQQLTQEATAYRCA